MKKDMDTHAQYNRLAKLIESWSYGKTLSVTDATGESMDIYAEAVPKLNRQKPDRRKPLAGFESAAGKKFVKGLKDYIGEARKRLAEGLPLDVAMKPIDFGTSDQDTILLLYALLISQEERIGKDPCSRIRVMRQTPVHRFLLGDRILSGRYFVAPTASSFDGILVLYTDAKGGLLKAPSADKSVTEAVNYARVLMHELGHGRTLMATPECLTALEQKICATQSIAADYVMSCAKDSVELAKRLKPYFNETVLLRREIAANVWMLREDCLELDRIMQEDIPGAKALLASVENAHNNTVELWRAGAPPAWVLLDIERGTEGISAFDAFD